MKRTLRKEVKAMLAAMDAAAAADKSRRACQALAALAEFDRAAVVMAYLSIPGELDATDLVRAALAGGKTLLVPRVIWASRQMDAVAIRSLDDGIEQTDYGLWEPADGQAWPVDGIDLIVVPALAYDRQGNRLGRGGGFYDRFLACAAPHAVTCGLAFDEQLVDRVPVEATDLPVDLLATDRQVLDFRTGGKTPGAQAQEE